MHNLLGVAVTPSSHSLLSLRPSLRVRTLHVPDAQCPTTATKDSHVKRKRGAEGGRGGSQPQLYRRAVRALYNLHRVRHALNHDAAAAVVVVVAAAAAAAAVLVEHHRHTAHRFGNATGRGGARGFGAEGDVLEGQLHLIVILLPFVHKVVQAYIVLQVLRPDRKRLLANVFGFAEHE